MLELSATISPSAQLGGVRAELRQLEADDWPTVREIFRQGIRSGLATFEVEAPSWQDWDTTHHAEHRLVAELGDRIVGWATLAPVSSRRVYAGVAEDSVYVADDAQGQGLGGALLSALVARAEAAGIWTIEAGIFPENGASIAVHQRCGFRIVGVREK
ncbi:MAG: N-acetyltransferase family protein, partial [Actinomycetota bacterium]|nr:N-acetyltransferase family protein [Actinomycetota bacterium]